MGLNNLINKFSDPIKHKYFCQHPHLNGECKLGKFQDMLLSWSTVYRLEEAPDYEEFAECARDIVNTTMDDYEFNKGKLESHELRKLHKGFKREFFLLEQGTNHVLVAAAQLRALKKTFWPLGVAGIVLAVSLAATFLFSNDAPLMGKSIELGTIVALLAGVLILALTVALSIRDCWSSERKISTWRKGGQATSNPPHTEQQLEAKDRQSLIPSF
jgi:hypothetical protein